MLGAQDLIRIMQERGSDRNPEPMKLGTMTAYNECMLGDELKLSAEQLYFFERDTLRQARTVRPPDQYDLEEEIHEGATSISPSKTKKEYDRVVYTRPYEKGDIVALQRMPDGRYLVLGRVIPGEKVTKVREQTDKDWSAADHEEET